MGLRTESESPANGFASPEADSDARQILQLPQMKNSLQINGLQKITRKNSIPRLHWMAGL